MVDAIRGLLPTGAEEPDCQEPTREAIAVEEVVLPARALRPVDERHVDVLAEVIDNLPPILVHRTTRMLIDGLHRLTVFRPAKRALIPVKWFDGTAEEALIEAIQANVAHGRPLTLKERKRAARMILQQDSDRSDRAVGRICGLDHKTVGMLRSQMALEAQRDLSRPDPSIGTPSDDHVLDDSLSTELDGSPSLRTVTSWSALEAYVSSASPLFPPSTRLCEVPAAVRAHLIDQARARSQWWASLAHTIEDYERGTNPSEAEATRPYQHHTDRLGQALPSCD